MQCLHPLPNMKKKKKKRGKKKRETENYVKGRRVNSFKTQSGLKFGVEIRPD
jgi:hypothetical protein